MPRHRILIADDHADTADSLADLLSLFGHETLRTYDGVQALEAVTRFKPNVVILDINMPIADGYHVVRTLRAAGGEQFIVAMTGASPRETKTKAMLAGFDVHMVKPISVEDLTRLLQELDEP